MLTILKPLVVRVFKLRAVGLENLPKTGAYLICANHSHLLDPFFVGGFVMRPVYQMASNEFFRRPLQARFMRAMGAFPRRKGSPHLKSIRYAIETVRSGIPLVIYPEGGRNWDGETLPSISSTAKLVKLLKVPLVTVVSKGNYLAWPRWADRRRRSPITIHYSEPVLFGEDASEKEIIRHIEKGIYNNDNYTPVPKIKGKDPARGLPRLLWRCPACRTLDALAEKDGSRIECGSCGKVWEVNLRCFMREEGGRTWRAVKEYSDLMFREDEVLPLKDPGSGLPERRPGERVYLRSRRVTLYREPLYPRIEKVGTGTLFLTDRGLVFVTEGNGDGGAGSGALSYDFAAILGRSTEKNTLFQIVLEKDIARFRMHGESCYKWELFYDFVRKRSGFRAHQE
jgi:1-acyl-sn-glycerol-3-phosphate acyltransferase